MNLLKRFRAWLRRPRLVRQHIGPATIFFNPRHDPVIRDYYLYITRLLADELKTNPIDADVIVGDYPHQPRAGRKVLRIDFQIEHTLVKPGGRGSEGAPKGIIAVPGHPEQRYLVRVQRLERLQRADAIIEYSRPNFVNLQRSGLYPELLRRMHYVAPLVYQPSWPFTVEGRDLEVITLFGNPEEPRRKALLERLRAWNPACRNIQGHFDDIRNIYRRTRILVNIRQTDHHDTLEELRVLPALLCGVIVISEDVPLREEVSYRDFVLWAPLADLPALVQEVHASYERRYAEIFAGDGLRQCIELIDKSNREQVSLCYNRPH